MLPGITLRLCILALLHVTLVWLLQELGLAPEECVYVGDSPSDARAARAAGMLSVGVTWGSHSMASVEAAFDLSVAAPEQLQQCLAMVLAGEASRQGDWAAAACSYQQLLRGVDEERIRRSQAAFQEQHQECNQQ